MPGRRRAQAVTGQASSRVMVATARAGPGTQSSAAAVAGRPEPQSRPRCPGPLQPGATGRLPAAASDSEAPAGCRDDKPEVCREVCSAAYHSRF
jgi:hypothetical protein